MRLHENWELFSDALQAASQPVEVGGLGIKSIFIEKDYWICRSLSLMAANDKDHTIYTDRLYNISWSALATVVPSLLSSSHSLSLIHI